MCDSCVDCIAFKMQLRLLTSRKKTLQAEFKTHKSASHTRKRKVEVIIDTPMPRRRVRSKLSTRLHQPTHSDDAIDPAGDIMPQFNPTLVRTKNNIMSLDNCDDIDKLERKAVDTPTLKDMSRVCNGRWCGTCGHDQHSGGQCYCIGGDNDGPDRWCTTCGFIDCICSLCKLQSLV
jgi:hypothetical protein